MKHISARFCHASATDGVASILVTPSDGSEPLAIALAPGQLMGVVQQLARIAWADYDLVSRRGP